MFRIEVYMIKIILTILLATQIIYSQVIQRLTADRFTQYKIDDWVSYAPALEISSVEIDENYIYFGTRLGGILRYNKYTNNHPALFYFFKYTNYYYPKNLYYR